MISQDNLGLIASTIKLMKPKKSMILAFTGSTVMGTLIAGKGFPSILPTILAIISSLFITISAYVYNDIIDLEMDKESKSSNKIDRALVTGKVTVETAKTIVIISSVIGIAISWFINITVFIITMIWYGLFMLYSFPAVRLKKMFIMKTLITSFGPAAAMLIGTSSIMGGIYGLGLFMSFVEWLFIFTILPGLSDTFDLEEDRKYGLKTLAMVLSWKAKIRLTIFGTFFVMFMSVLAHYWYSLHVIFPMFCIVSGFYFIRQILTVYNKFEAEKVWRVRRIGFTFWYLNLFFVILSTSNLGSILLFF
jgi:4-hydroxybenzoate polyprenyltransferase